MEQSLNENQIQSSQIPETEYTLHRRFDRMGRLVGDEAMKQLFKSHVMIVGLGGVGGWAAESLARSGVGHLSLVDFDEVCITNTNRQLQAMSGTVGKKKSEVLKERLSRINPQAQVEALTMFYNAETSEGILSRKPDVIIDAIDNITAKAHLLATSLAQKFNIITAAGAGGRMDPLAIRVADLADTSEDPLAASMRKILRQKYNFSREGKFGIPCVYSVEPHREPIELKYDKGLGFKCVCPHGANDFHSCEKRNVIYGTSSFVTGAFGLNLAALVVQKLLGDHSKWQ